MEGMRREGQLTPDSLEFTYRVVNCGKTPARIVEWSARFHTVVSEGGLPDDPQYGELHAPAGIDGLVAPGQLFSFTKKFEGEEGRLSLEQVEAVKSGKLGVWSYTRVVYRDAFGRQHETRACYAYFFTEGNWGFRTAGPRKYNDYT